MRTGVSFAKGEYQAVYRSVDLYHQLFQEVGIACMEVRQNPGYNNMVIAEGMVDLRRKLLPFTPKDSPLLGLLTSCTELVAFGASL